MNLLSMYSGIGGFDLAAAWAGFTTVALCDKDKYCQKLLAKRFPGIPIFEEDTHVSAKSLGERGIDPAGITIIVGGYPCPGESLAGQRRGAADDRWRWPEMFRIIKELRPRWVCCENVIGHVTMGLDGVLLDLENIGYQAWPVTIPACAIGAPHRRERVFIIASNADSNSEWRKSEFLSRRTFPAEFTDDGKQGNVAYANGEREQQPARNERQEWNGISDSGQTMADAYSRELSRSRTAWYGRPEFTDSGKNVPDPERQSLAFGVGGFGIQEGKGSFPAITGSSWWEFEPEVGRVVDGLPGRVDRLRALGNAIVPQQVYPILRAIAEQEKLWSI